MEFDPKLTETHQIWFQDQNHNNTMKDYFPFVTQKSNILQGFQNLDQFYHNGSSMNPNLEGNNQCYNDTFDGYNPFNFSTNVVDLYESKPLLIQDGVHGDGHGHVMDNFHDNINNEGLNFSVGMMASTYNQGQMLGFDYAEHVTPMNFVMPDEVSCVSAENELFKKVGIRLPTTRRTWKGRKKSNVVKGQWTIEEDKILIQLVDEYGVRKWSQIAQMLPGRIGKQCRERWHNHLRPDIKKDTWSEEEDKILIQAHMEIGNKWAEIAKRLPGRTENSIKNHWNATKRRQFSKRKCRSKYPRGSILQDYIKSLNLTSSTNNGRRYNKETNVVSNDAINRTQEDKTSSVCPSLEDLKEIPDLCFDGKLFEESCSIESFLDEINIALVVDDGDGGDVDDKEEEEKEKEKIMEIDDVTPLMNFEMKKEVDLVEMISHVDV